jgi:hypothetical protein
LGIPLGFKRLEEAVVAGLPVFHLGEAVALIEGVDGLGAVGLGDFRLVPLAVSPGFRRRELLLSSAGRTASAMQRGGR